jgi:hypothetical protein
LLPTLCLQCLILRLSLSGVFCSAPFLGLEWWGCWGAGPFALCMGGGGKNEV